MTRRNGSQSNRRRKRRVCVVTGTRAEYGLLRSTLAAIDQHPNMELLLVATGLHLLRPFGQTVRQIERDGWRIDARIPMQRGDRKAVAPSTGCCIHP